MYIQYHQHHLFEFFLTGNVSFNLKASSTRESGYIQAVTRTDGFLSVPCRRLEFSMDMVD